MSEPTRSEPFERDLRAVLAEPVPHDVPAALRAVALDPGARRSAQNHRPRPLGSAPALVVAFVGIAAVVVVLVSLPLLAGVGGGVGGPPRVVRFNWQTSTVGFQAAGVTITAADRAFVPPSTLDVRSDPGDPTYTTLEVTWGDQGLEMRLYIYFRADGSRWWSDEIRTYDGRDTANWIYYRGRFFDQPLGHAFDGDLNLTSSIADAPGVTGTLHLTGLSLIAFRGPLPSNGATTGPAPTPAGGPISTSALAVPVPAAPTPSPVSPAPDAAGPAATPDASASIEHSVAPAAAPSTAAPSVAPSPLATASAAIATPKPSPAWTPVAMDRPPGPLTPFQIVDLGTDRRTVTITFVAGKPYSASDPCSRAYAGAVAINGDRLQLAVIDTSPTAFSSQPCDAIGYARTLTLTLADPFDGSIVYDMAGYTHFLAAPAGLVKVNGLPNGWVLRTSRDVEGSPTGRWERIWSAIAKPTKDDPQLSLIQAFGGPPDVSGGDETSQVAINGIPAILWRHAPTGELLLTWQFGPDGLALTGNEHDFTKEQFIALAESITAA